MEETSNSCDKTNLKACRTFTGVDLIFAVLMKFRTADKKLVLVYKLILSVWVFKNTTMAEDVGDAVALLPVLFVSNIS